MIAGREAEEATRREAREESLSSVALHPGIASSRLAHTFVALALAVATAGLYLAQARLIAGELGYPLDDAWIHQTYARNLAHLGEWSFVPGTPSAGSTSPLWTLLLAIPHWFPGDLRLWTYAFGLLSLLGTAWATTRLTRALFDDARLAPWVGLAVLVEWHLTWAAVSGMEILLYTFLATLLLALALAPHLALRPLLWGVLGGLLTLTRPEGLWLVALIWLVLVLRSRQGHLDRSARHTGAYVAGWLILVAPYLLVNWHLTGRPFPNTFYAKQAEYHLLIDTIPLWQRLLTQAWLPWIGGQVLFLLGLGWVAVRLAWGRRRGVGGQWATSNERGTTGNQPQKTANRIRLLVPAVWALGLITIYALRLPVTYQHGRYLMPIIPVALVYGLWAFRALVTATPRILSRSLVISAGVVFLLFWIRGSLAYAEDTAVITCEMVGTARWVATTTKPTDLIAAHDIGALGYFADRPLLDLAGLVSPETIPLLRDESGLLHLMQARGVTHVIFFPDWYPVMAHAPALRLVSQRDCPVTRAAGHQSLAVYETAWSSLVTVQPKMQSAPGRIWPTYSRFSPPERIFRRSGSRLFPLLETKLQYHKHRLK
ncbi:MAG TPA: hypothetical protein DEP84_14680 [Chloroflexi bacterium]|nr:hypothetical protein [Chloroflexota bacterium]